MEDSTQTQVFRRCRADEQGDILTIINSAAEAYRGAIPDDCWHDPYMSSAEFDYEIANGVVFLGCDVAGRLAGVMGTQLVEDVELIRHAYVLPDMQGRGIGGALIRQLIVHARRPLLVGTWAAADWAIGFYRGHDFTLVPESRKNALLRRYWTVPDRQIETSVVLAHRQGAAMVQDPAE